MLEMFRSMIKEEWRIHSSLFGGTMFALFPFILLSIAFIGSMLLPSLTKVIPLSQMFLVMQYSFVLLGLSVGSFGLFGKEIMNRRFGSASLLAYSSRTLPVSEKIIFLNFFIKDIVYYFFLWVLPFAAGFALASTLTSVSLAYSLSLLLVLTLSFLIGLSVAFFLSTIYAHSLKLLLILLAVFAIIVFSIEAYFSISILSVVPDFSYSPSFNQILFSLSGSVILSAISLYFLKVDYPIRKRYFKNSLDGLSKAFSFSSDSVFISKDLLDFSRSRGGLGKIIFSFILPLALIFWLLTSVLLTSIPNSNSFILFSIFLGIMSSSFYNWLTEYDSFSSYSFLPVRVSALMESKIFTYLMLNAVSIFILIFVAYWTDNFYYFLPALFSFASISAYALSIIIYLGGLSPNIMLYNAKIFLEYILLLSPVLLILIFLSIINPFYLLISIVLIPVSCRIIKKGYEKWDDAEQAVI
jgi:hypothetical protein